MKAKIKAVCEDEGKSLSDAIGAPRSVFEIR